MTARLSIPTVIPASQLAPTHSLFPALATPAGVDFPRGRITEVYGAASSGRTSLLYSALAQATSERESCALVDADDAFDPASAAAAGVELHRLLWVRCAGNAGHAMRVADLLLQGAGFGVVALDFASTGARAANRIPPSYWYRFRLAVEQSRTALIVVSPMPNVRQCASLAVEARRVEARWSGTPGCSQLLEGISLAFDTRKPVAQKSVAAHLEARALTA
jgi:recA bacterial DNA recombination protein